MKQVRHPTHHRYNDPPNVQYTNGDGKRALTWILGVCSFAITAGVLWGATQLVQTSKDQAKELNDVKTQLAVMNYRICQLEQVYCTPLKSTSLVAEVGG